MVKRDARVRRRVDVEDIVLETAEEGVLGNGGFEEEEEEGKETGGGCGKEEEVVVVESRISR